MPLKYLYVFYIEKTESDCCTIWPAEISLSVTWLPAGSLYTVHSATMLD